MSRKRSESEKELVIYKTLNLEERRRLIKHHHKIRRYENQNTSSSEGNDSSIQEKSQTRGVKTVVGSSDPSVQGALSEANEFMDLDTIEEETNNNEEVKS